MSSNLTGSRSFRPRPRDRLPFLAPIFLFLFVCLFVLVNARTSRLHPFAPLRLTSGQIRTHLTFVAAPWLCASVPLWFDSHFTFHVSRFTHHSVIQSFCPLCVLCALSRRTRPWTSDFRLQLSVFVTICHWIFIYIFLSKHHRASNASS